MSIADMNFKERSLLFAKLAKISYYTEKKATSQAKKLGFTTTEFYNRDGAQAYRFMNTKDIVIACRGTEPTEWNDIAADLKAIPVMAETVSRVHKGFKEEVDELLSCELRSITVSLQGTVKSKSDPSELVDILPSEQTPPMELAELAERTASAWKLLDKANLTEKERKIVSLRFGLDGSNEWRTLAEVARHMSCSREYCRQVVQRALRKLRKAGIQNGLVDSIS